MADFDFMGGLGDLLGGLGGGIGAFIGGLQGEGNREEARRYLQQITNLYRDIDPNVTASLEDVVELGPSAYDGIGTELDPETRAAQTRAYKGLMERGLSGGMDAGSRAALSEGLAESAQQESGARQALQQRFASQGRGGSMAELAAQLSNTQSAAEGNNRAATRAAGDASARAYQALAQGGALAGQARGQDYQQASDKASARDLVAQHNARNRQGVYGRNTDRRNGAAEATMRNRFLRAGGQAQGLRGLSDAEYREEERLARQGLGAGSTVGRAVGSAAGAFF